MGLNLTGYVSHRKTCTLFRTSCCDQDVVLVEVVDPAMMLAKHGLVVYLQIIQQLHSRTQDIITPSPICIVRWEPSLRCNPVNKQAA